MDRMGFHGFWRCLLSILSILAILSEPPVWRMLSLGEPRRESAEGKGEGLLKDDHRVRQSGWGIFRVASR
jgi:hypothetical protein